MTTANYTALSLPAFYDQSHAYEDHYHVANAWDIQKAAAQWKVQQGLKNVGSDRVRVHLLVIDNQNDFDFPSGTLFVGGRSGKGAMNDQDRLAQFIYRNLAVLSEITCTMDSHHPYQVFYSSAHLLRDGSHPEPFTIITADDYASGTYRPNPAMAVQLGVDINWLTKQFVYYTKELENRKKLPLTIWPYHCIIGSAGHPLAGVVDEARLFHAFARGAANPVEVKGTSALTEHFSIFQPEVLTTWDSRAIPGAQRNTRLLEKLLRSDVVIIAGQAMSHCLSWSVSDLLTEIRAQDPTLAEKVYILRDCTSPVVVPGVVDYTDQAEDDFTRFAAAGMKLVDTTTPIDQWPGIAGQLFG